ncbi:DUF2637 domain-containing protein [Actinocorallia libanotica]|uniref:DUF2637 domain-containing protein n=1 Tax=Actinocorallia libanotica TaxID=46162 RepID=A0ABN1RY15_9ACTN
MKTHGKEFKRSTGDRVIRVSMTVTVLGVALVAGWVSYWHAVEVVRRYGAEQDPAIHLIPLTIDGMIYASSMSMLWAARYGLKAGWLSRTALVCGIAATLAANVLQGLEHGPLAAAIAAWPAVALVISYELTMWVVRSSRDLSDRQTTAETDQVREEAQTGQEVAGSSVSDTVVLAVVPEQEDHGDEADADPDRSGSVSAATVADRITVRTTVGKPAGKREGKSAKKPAYSVEQLAQARRIDAEHRASKGRPISAENLARTMRVAKATALALVKVVRSEVAHPDIDAKQELAHPDADAGQHVAVPAQGWEAAR